jgi:hypothetical protein
MPLLQLFTKSLLYRRPTPRVLTLSRVRLSNISTQGTRQFLTKRPTYPAQIPPIVAHTTDNKCSVLSQTPSDFFTRWLRLI